jgi:hypothetical protein
MDSRRFKKSRSIAIEPKTSRPAPATTRPLLVDRTHSDPALVRRHGQGQLQRREDHRVSEVRISEVVERDSQASIRDDPFFRTYQSPHSTRLAAESRLAQGVINHDEDVCRPFKSWSQVSGPVHVAFLLAARQFAC